VSTTESTSNPAHASSVTSAKAPLAPDAEALAIAAAMRARNPKADPLARIPDVHPARIPRHIAIIMDGNGRWARQRGFPRIFGHRNGAGALRAVVEEAGLLGVEYLTLYSFSIENWRRPRDEVEFLMQLALTYLEGELDHLRREGVRLRVIGRREGLPPDVAAAINRVEAATQDQTRATLAIALNYGSRAELVDAARSLARDVAAGRLDPAAIDEATFASRLYTHGIPDPDLLIRTAGEMRVSNYLLWQISYAEIHVTPTLWPDFTPEHLREAIRDFARRDRRFGGVNTPPSPSSPSTPAPSAPSVATRGTDA
jgi:undecaprenyl diphosphate synthase